MKRSASLSYAELPVQDLFIGLAGSYQRVNAAIAVQALRKAGIKLNQKALKEGLANVSWPGRFQHDRRTNDPGRSPQPGRIEVPG